MPRGVHGATTSLAPTDEANPLVFPNSCTWIHTAEQPRGTQTVLLWDETKLAATVTKVSLGCRSRPEVVQSKARKTCTAQGQVLSTHCLSPFALTPHQCRYSPYACQRDVSQLLHVHQHCNCLGRTGSCSGQRNCQCHPVPLLAGLARTLFWLAPRAFPWDQHHAVTAGGVPSASWALQTSTPPPRPLYKSPSPPPHSIQ